MTQWIKLKDLCTLITDGSHYSPEAVENGYPMLSVKDMRESDFSFAECKYINKEEYQNMKKNDCVPKVNDILIAKDGSYLKHVFVVKEEREIAILSSIGILRPNLELVDPYYIKYYLSMDSVKYMVGRQYVSGSALPRIILKNFGEIKIPYVNLEEQKRIVSVLKDIDTKIIVNNKSISVLEDMSKMIFDYWFLQFDFPDENGNPYRSSGGKMVWNDELKREIPEGWTSKKLEELADFGNGINYDKDIKGDKDYKIVNVRNITSSSLLIDKSDLDDICLKRDLSDKYLINKNDILIARSGTPGAVRLLLDNDNALYCGFIIHCLPVDAEDRLYLTFSLKKYEGTNATKTGGSILQNVSQSTLKDLNIVYPNKEFIIKFNNKIQPLIDMMQNIIKENDELSSLRDFLLPLLMNGQVTFKEG